MDIPNKLGEGKPCVRQVRGEFMTLQLFVLCVCGETQSQRQRKTDTERLISFQIQGFTVSPLKYEKSSWSNSAMENFTLTLII